MAWERDPHIQRVTDIILFMQGFQKLKYVDFSTSYSITGSFLRSVILNKTLQETVEVHILSICWDYLFIYLFLLAVLSLNMKTFIFQKPWKLHWWEFAWGLNFKGLYASERSENRNIFTIPCLFLNHSFWNANAIMCRWKLLGCWQQFLQAISNCLYILWVHRKMLNC